jgi:hypothetical protein
VRRRFKLQRQITVKYSPPLIDVYFLVDGVRYWALLTPSGLVLYRREGSKTRHLGRRSTAEVKEMLAKAGAEAVQKIKAELEAVKQAVESQKLAQTAQTPSLTWKKDGHTYWLILYAKSVYVYMKGPSTKHKPRLIEKSDISGVIGRLVAAGALHVLETLRLVVNGLYSAVADLLRSQRSAAGEAQVPRSEAEEALVALRRRLRREVAAWREKYKLRMEREGLYEVDPRWVRKDLAEFLRENRHLLEKILSHRDLVDDLADAVEEETYGYVTRYDVLETLNQL